MRAIDADKLIDDLYELKHTKESPSIILTPAGQEIYNSGVESAIGAVLGAPTIDSAPVVHARWEDHHCTNCVAMCVTAKTPQDWVYNIETPYCPHCGAKMDG